MCFTTPGSYKDCYNLHLIYYLPGIFWILNWNQCGAEQSDKKCMLAFWNDEMTGFYHSSENILSLSFPILSREGWGRWVNPDSPHFASSNLEQDTAPLAPGEV